MFSKKDLKKLILPLIVEQVLLVAVGMADTVMISSVGEAAVSGVSLVDNINILIINIFAALATGGAVVAGHSLGEHGDVLTEMAAQRACSLCQRQDIPEEMEQAVAAMVLSLAEGGETVKSLQRGDTAITYDVSQCGTAALLAPFRRLGIPKEGQI